MVIDIANFNFDGGSGGGGKPALLQEKTVTIVENGSQTITPDEGFDGMSSVQINAAITGDSSAIDFSSIGYDAEFSAEAIDNINDDIAYSKSLYDAWNPSNTSAYNLYKGNKKLVYAPHIDTSNVTDMGNMFSGCTIITTIPSFDTINVTNMNYMFSNCNRLTTIPELDTRNVTNMNYMFSNCNSIKTVPTFDTSSVTSMNNMFYYCSSLTTIPELDTSNVTNMNYMFCYCQKLTSVPALDTRNVTNMSDMFSRCSVLTSVPAFDTRNVTNMNNMFYYCSSLTTIPAFDTSNVNTFQDIFSGCFSLTSIEGISFKSFSASTMRSSYLTSSQNSTIRKAVFKDIGYKSTAKQFNTSYIENWGVNTDEIPDARQSLIDSLITYSFDRASAGYPTCNITLSDNTRALLTEDEKAQIEAKGYLLL